MSARYQTSSPEVWPTYRTREMLSEDIWVYIASYYLDSCDTSNLSRTCWSLRRFLLPLVFREQTFEGFNYYSTQSFLDSFSHFSKIKRRILFYSQHPQIATFIQKLEIRNWIHTYVYPKLENTTEPRQQRLVRQDPLAENLMDMHREMVSYCTVLYADLLQMITTLPNLSILAFREGKITHGQQYSRFWEPAVTITNPLRSYNFLEFARGSQCAWKLALPEVFTDGSVARYGYPPWQRYFREIIQSPFLKLTSARLLGDFLATLPTPLLQKFAGIRNLGIIFCANRNLESKLSENIQTIVGAGNALRTLAIVPYRSQSMILQSALPDLPNLDKYCGPAELLRALDLKNHLTSLSLIDSKWDVVAPILKDLPVTCRERIRRLDLSWFAFLSRNDLSEAAIIWPRVEDLTLWHRGKSEEMSVIPQLFIFISPFSCLRKLRILGCMDIRQTGIPLYLIRQRPIPSLEKVGFDGLSILHWSMTDGWVHVPHSSGDSTEVAAEDVQAAIILLQRLFPTFSWRTNSQMSRKELPKRLFRRLLQNLHRNP